MSEYEASCAHCGARVRFNIQSVRENGIFAGVKITGRCKKCGRDVPQVEIPEEKVRMIRALEAGEEPSPPSPNISH
jgi:hypothetical protein